MTEEIPFLAADHPWERATIMESVSNGGLRGD